MPTALNAPPLASLLILIGAATPAYPQATLPSNFQDSPVVGGLSSPTGISFLPDGRCLVVEQLTGRIRLIVNGALSPTDPVCVVPNVRDDDFYRGLLGIAVDPRWPDPPYLYVHYAANPGRLLISRFTVAGDLDFTGNGALTIDPATRYELINIPDAAHNGGSLRFGSDQMLYASVGDSFTSPETARSGTAARAWNSRRTRARSDASRTPAPSASIRLGPRLHGSKRRVHRRPRIR